MPRPTREQLETWADGYVALWNAGKKQAWIENWKRVAPGSFSMLDPVGTPEKRGFEACAADLFQPTTRLWVDPETRFICDNEVAWVMENRFSKDGAESVHRSIEIFRFEPDGSVRIRTYYLVPGASDAAAGGLFQEYLPGKG
jgi:hypothetical protein